MRAPLSWIKEFVDIPSSVTAEQISDGLIRVGFEVEEIIKQGADLSVCPWGYLGIRDREVEAIPKNEVSCWCR